MCGHREWPALAKFEAIVEDVVYRGLLPFSSAPSAKRARGTDTESAPTESSESNDT